MSLNDMNNGGGYAMTMPVAPLFGGGYPAAGGYGGGGGLGGFGGDYAWLLLFMILLGGGMWGGMGMGGMMWPMMLGGMGGGLGLDYLYPWLNNSQHISDGFRDQQLNSQIGDLRSDVNRGFGDVQLGISGLGRQICETGSGITQAVNSGFSAAEIAANGRQMANMQQGYAMQTAMMQGFNAAQAQAADCCCKTQTGIADLRYTEATEACATRTAAYQNTRDIIDNQNRVGQSILDKLCQLELDGYKRQISDEQRENANLRNENQYLRNEASRVAQTAVFERGLNNEVDALYNRLKNCPVGTVPVAGNTPLFSCNPGFNNGGCGCNSNSFGFAT